MSDRVQTITLGQLLTKKRFDRVVLGFNLGKPLFYLSKLEGQAGSIELGIGPLCFSRSMKVI